MNIALSRYRYSALIFVFSRLTREGWNCVHRCSVFTNSEHIEIVNKKTLAQNYHMPSHSSPIEFSLTNHLKLDICSFLYYVQN
jgi:hypothetical protein